MNAEQCKWIVDYDQKLAKAGCNGQIFNLLEVAHLDYCPACRKELANVKTSTHIPLGREQEDKENDKN